jgi:hypothetical protein
MRQRRFSPALLASVMTSLWLGGLGSAASAAPAKPASLLSLGEVSIAMDAGVGGAATLEVDRALRAALAEELSQVPSPERPARPLIVSARLTRVSSERLASGLKASAAISLALLRADDQLLLGELRGHASVEEASTSPNAVRSAALRHAVHSAMTRLPQALRHSEQQREHDRK